LKCIAGIETPDEGKIILNGRTLFDSEKKINLIPQKRKVGYMFQDYALFPNMTVEKNIMAGMGKKPQKEIVQDYIRRFRLEGLEHHLPRQLSGGQKQRLALAGALAMHPKAILLDEAMSMLDPRSRRDFTEIIAAEHKKGLTIVEVTHRLDEIRGADRVIVLADGVISTDVSAKEFFKKSEAELLAMNLAKPPLDRLHERLVLDGLIPAETAASVEGIEEKLLCR